MKNLPIRIGAIVTVAGVAALTFVGGVAPASAATAATAQCVIEPFHTNVVHHDDMWRIDTTTVPGKDAVVYDEQRWSKLVPAVEEVSFNETKYERVIPGNEEVSHMQWLYKWFVPGNKEESHKEYRYFHKVPAVAEISHLEQKFSRTVEGVKEVSHKEYRFTRENPGKAETFHQEQQFTRNIPGQAEKSHQEYKYQQSVTQYRFRDRVERPDNTVERKFIKGYDFVDGGTTRVGNKTVAGHWVVSAGWHSIPDSIINVVWGSGGVPPQYLGGSETNPKGNVNLSTYGGPNVNSPYYASLVTIDGGYTDYGPWSDWTTTNPGADTATRDAESQTIVTPYKGGAWTTDTPGAPWVKVDEKKTIDVPAVTARTEYLKADGTASTNSADAGWFQQTSFDSWTKFGASKTVSNNDYVAPFVEFRKADGTPTTDVAQAAYTPESSFPGWNQYGTPKVVVTVEATPDYKEYRTADGSASLNEADAALFEETSFPGWVKFGESEKVVVKEAVAGFTEFLKEDGTTSLNSADAGWFEEESFPEWERFGDSKTEVTQEATPDQTFYLTKDAQGNLGQTTVKSEASLFTNDDAAVDSKWVKIDEEKKVTQEATEDKTVYLTQTDEGVFGESEDIDDATWISEEDTTVDLAIWQQMVDKHGDPLVNKHITTEAEPGYTVFFNPTGEPTRELGESNWTKMTPEGWKFVDSRTVEETKAIPPLVNEVKVLDKAAYDEKIDVAAKYGPCASQSLASTGGEIPWGPAGFAAVAIALGLGLAIRARHRKVGPAN